MLQREYWDQLPFTVTADSESNVEFIDFIFNLDLRRETRLKPDPCPPMVIAYDSQESVSATGEREGSFAYLISDPCSGQRWGAFGGISMDVPSEWTPSHQQIQCTEATALLAGVTYENAYPQHWAVY